MFAEDCLVYRKINSFDNQLALQRDLDAFEVYGMKFNPNKCTILSMARSSDMHKFYTLCGIALQHANEAKYLGVMTFSGPSIYRICL